MISYYMVQQETHSQYWFDVGEKYEKYEDAIEYYDAIVKEWDDSKLRRTRFRLIKRNITETTIRIEL